jgi:hypothetical protein
MVDLHGLKVQSPESCWDGKKENRVNKIYDGKNKLKEQKKSNELNSLPGNCFIAYI